MPIYNNELSNNVFICKCSAEHILTNAETLYLCGGSEWLYKCSVCGRMERATSKNTKKVNKR